MFVLWLQHFGRLAIKTLAQTQQSNGSSANVVFSFLKYQFEAHSIIVLLYISLGKTVLLGLIYNDRGFSILIKIQEGSET